MKNKTAGDVIVIDEVEYLVGSETINQLEKGEELIPIKRLIDKRVFAVSRDKFEKSEVVDHLENKI